MWTASDPLGASFVDSSCGNWTNTTTSNPIANVGRTDATDLNWTSTSQQTCNATNPRLYCIEQGAAPTPPGPGPANCPSSIAFTSPTVDKAYGGSGGTVRPRICPAGQVAVGNTLYENRTMTVDLINGLVAVCGTISVVPGSCQVAITAGTTFPLDGSTVNTGPLDRICPANQMVVAVQGRSGAALDQLSFGCASLTLAKVGSNYQATVNAITWLAAVGGTGGSAFTSLCPTGQIAIGSDIRSGVALDAFGLLCAKPVLMP